VHFTEIPLRPDCSKWQDKLMHRLLTRYRLVGCSRQSLDFRKPSASKHYAGVLAFKKVRKWRTAIWTRSLGSFQGKKVICAFGASNADSSAGP
jgi:hypothetical protein